MRVLLSWSTGKDSAWSLHVLRTSGVEVVALLSTLDQGTERVSMQGVGRELLHVQADAVGLPVWEMPLPSPCPNEEYERRMGEVIRRAEGQGITHVAFGDLYLADVRAYREEMMASTAVKPLFPIWLEEETTAQLAAEMVRAGLRAVITCVDPSQLDPSFVGEEWEPSRLPAGVDPLGERGEFHTFCHTGPTFPRPIPVSVGERMERDGFWWADVSSA